MKNLKILSLICFVGASSAFATQGSLVNYQCPPGYQKAIITSNNGKINIHTQSETVTQSDVDNITDYYKNRLQSNQYDIVCLDKSNQKNRRHLRDAAYGGISTALGNAAQQYQQDNSLTSLTSQVGTSTTKLNAKAIADQLQKLADKYKEIAKNEQKPLRIDEKTQKAFDLLNQTCPKCYEAAWHVYMKQLHAKRTQSQEIDREAFKQALTQSLIDARSIQQDAMSLSDNIR